MFLIPCLVYTGFISLLSLFQVFSMFHSLLSVLIFTFQLISDFVYESFPSETHFV